MIGTETPVTLTLTTNLASYTFPGLVLPPAEVSLSFYGFIASAGEYFTGFHAASLGGTGSAPVFDNVTLGTTAAVAPEPAAVSLLTLALAAAVRRAARARQN